MAMANQTIKTHFVFKVKCGDNLKRIHGCMDDQLYSSLGHLRSKIRESFNILSERDFDLTYVDKDGDSVMLADDSDLFDATVNQGLNPVKINIELIPQKLLTPKPETEIKPNHKNRMQVQQIENKSDKKDETSAPVSSNPVQASNAETTTHSSKQASELNNGTRCDGWAAEDMTPGMLHKCVFFLISYILRTILSFMLEDGLQCDLGKGKAVVKKWGGLLQAILPELNRMGFVDEEMNREIPRLFADTGSMTEDDLLDDDGEV